ncbi:MAG: metallophosphoesterase family protein, partial [Lewinella sp.]|nr:metallophosphoesterase family protein [Lewinella sp.]
LLAGLWPVHAQAAIDHLRASWRDDPATTMVIGWDQVSGSEAVLYYDMVDHGQQWNAYRQQQAPQREVRFKGMHNHFARLSGLRPNTVYYAVIRDNQGVSQPFSFKTAPNQPNERLSFILGSDSRNYREARRNANRLVSKLRPHAVFFGGDFTNGDTDLEWQDWFVDWSLTQGSDGRLFPIVAARGNHEATNEVVVNLFDVPSPDAIYALTFGGNLVRAYTLNTLLPAGGEQRDWLEGDLRDHQDIRWRIGQYHQAMRPHTSGKPERDELILHWATLFNKYRVAMVMESDAHCVKATWPIRPSREPGSDEGFIRDDETGTVYLGEGGWGAPLRADDDPKPWTRASGSFNQFKWVFIDRESIEIRTVKTDAADRVGEVDPNNIFEPPYGLVLWNPPAGDVITIRNRQPLASAAPAPRQQQQQTQMQTGTPPPMELTSLAARLQQNRIVLTWASVAERPGAVFEIQRSTDGGVRYETLTTLPGQGPGPNFQYQFADSPQAAGTPAPLVRYRVRLRLPSGYTMEDICNLEAPPPAPTAASPPATDLLRRDAQGNVHITYQLTEPGQVVIILINSDLQEMARLNYDNQPAGQYEKSLDLSRAPAGQFSLIIKANGQLLKRYSVLL